MGKSLDKKILKLIRVGSVLLTGAYKRLVLSPLAVKLLNETWNFNLTIFSFIEYFPLFYGAEVWSSTMKISVTK